MNTDFFTQYTNLKSVFGEIPKEIVGLRHDTREIAKNECFLALKGLRDGHEFLENARQNGASCAVVEHINYTINIPQIQVDNVLNFAKWAVQKYRKHLKLIAISGSYGKTSVKDLLQTIFQQDAQSTEKNYNNELGVILTISKIKPDKIGIIEAGIDKPEEMQILSQLIRPDISITTGISHVHVSNFKTFEDLINEKASIVEDTINNGGKAIFTEQCLQFTQFRYLQSRAIIVSKNITNSPHQNFIHYTIDKNENNCCVNIFSKYFNNCKFDIPRISNGLIEDFVLSVVAAKSFNLSNSTIQNNITRWESSSLRGEEIKFHDAIIFLDCYNANFDAMKDSWCFFNEKYQSYNNKIYIFGAMRELGNFSDTIHIQLAQFIEKNFQSYNIKFNCMFLIGEEIFPAYQYLRNTMSNNRKIFYFQNTKDARDTIVSSIINAQDAAVFVKGSRFFQLETLFL